MNGSPRRPEPEQSWLERNYAYLMLAMMAVEMMLVGALVWHEFTH